MSEHQEQVKLFRMFAASEDFDMRVLMTMIFAIPNESYGGTKRDMLHGKRLKNAGRKVGVPDICVPIARGGYYGCFIEMKVGYNKPSKKQEMWINNLRKQNYFVKVCYSAEAAYTIILDYLKHHDLHILGK